MATPRWTSRAVLRIIEAGSSVSCAHCGQAVKFRVREKAKQVICNVYDNGSWDRVEHFHGSCYDEAGAPFGPADDSQPLRQRPRGRSATTAA